MKSIRLFKTNSESMIKLYYFENLKADVLKFRTCPIVIVFISEADKLENTANYFNLNVVVVIRTICYENRGK